MKRIVKDGAPDFLDTYVKKHPKSVYCDLDTIEDGRMLRNQLREHLVKHQKMICCYCCSSIEADASSAHNEHIKPQSVYPKESLRYDNLLASCNGNNICGKAKGNRYEEGRFVFPTEEGCEDHFYYLENGRIEGATDEGRNTIKLLNLNQSNLVAKRKSQFRQCLTLAQCMGKEYVLQEYIQENNGKLREYVDMTTYFYNRGVFDSDICDASN